jgi:hypothetical protein
VVQHLIRTRRNGAEMRQSRALAYVKVRFLRCHPASTQRADSSEVMLIQMMANTSV